MMSGSIYNQVVDSVTVQTPWPDDAQLYQPCEIEQILLPDNANCLSVQAYLKMCGLKYKVVYKSNAEYMSPSGRVPFLKCGAFLVPEFEGVISHVQNKSLSISKDLENNKKGDMRTYMSLITTTLQNAELYVTWCDPDVYAKVTWPRHGSVYPWPLNWILTYKKRRLAVRKLEAAGWYAKSLEEVYLEVENCCKALSARLEKSDFFFGDQPTELDALVFGHVYTIITTPLPNNKFAGIVRSFTNIVNHCRRIEEQYFSNSTGSDQHDQQPSEEITEQINIFVQ